MTYTGPKPTYINLLSKSPKHEPVYATREYSTPLFYVIHDVSVRWLHAILAISHSQCAVVLSHNEIAEILDLLEYVASTARSRTRQVYNERSSIDTDGTSTTRQPYRLNHQRQFPGPVWSQIIQIHY